MRRQVRLVVQRAAGQQVPVQPVGVPVRELVFPAVRSLALRRLLLRECSGSCRPQPGTSGRPEFPDRRWAGCDPATGSCGK